MFDPALPTLHCDLLVIGAGPAGVAAALTAAAAGQRVLLVDQQQDPGGQIWRGQWRELVQSGRCSDALAQRWLPALRAALQANAGRRIVFRGACRVVHRSDNHTVVADGEQAAIIAYQQVILAAGAREVLLPFPGWTLPGVTGAGGLQVMVKDGVSVHGQRIVVAGTGPLLLAVAASLQATGAHVVGIFEQASNASLLAFTSQLWRYPALCWQALGLRWQTRHIPWHTASWITSAEGGETVTGVHWRNAQGKHGQLDCSRLACGYGLTENSELLALFADSNSVNKKRSTATETSVRAATADAIRPGITTADVATAQPGVWIAGELLGIGGARRAIISGQRAAAETVGAAAQGRQLQGQLQRWNRYVSALAQQFALRDKVRHLAIDNTVLCRCEAVTVGAARAHADFRSAKLATRLGMGACQGRICGSACQQLFGWRADHTRAPLAPTPIRTLMQSAGIEAVAVSSSTKRVSGDSE